MPLRPPRICGCGHRIASGVRCACEVRRASESKARAERNRPSARQRGYTNDWARESKAFLARPGNGLCACGCGRASEMVDHILAPKGDMRLFWNRANWQPMARVCNTRKAIRQEGGFGKSIEAEKSRGTQWKRA